MLYSLTKSQVATHARNAHTNKMHSKHHHLSLLYSHICPFTHFSAATTAGAAIVDCVVIPHTFAPYST